MKINPPTNCPCCNHLLVRVENQFFCRNISCSAQVNGKLQHFTKTLGIKGFGEKTVEKLDLASIAELYYLDRADIVAALGSEKIADKLLDEIERSKVADLATVIASFSIPLIGRTAGQKLATVVKSIEEITPETCKTAGLGEKATYNLVTWIANEYAELKDFLPFKFGTQSVASVNEDSEVVCITGKLKSFKTKAEATTILTSLGFKVSDSVNKNTTYLVDEDGKNSLKRQKADDYNVIIITNLLDFINKVNQND